MITLDLKGPSPIAASVLRNLLCDTEPGHMKWAGDRAGLDFARDLILKAYPMPPTAISPPPISM